MRINHALNLSLERRALVIVAAQLLNVEDGELVLKVLSEYKYKVELKRRVIEEPAVAKAESLILPVQVKEKLVNLIGVLSLEVLRWIEYHCLNKFLDFKVPKRFYWRTNGTIDYKKTAEEIIKQENEDAVKLFKLASIYCLEKYIPPLWKKLHDTGKEKFVRVYDAGMVTEVSLILFWRFSMEGELHRFNNINENCNARQFVFENAVIGGNDTATEYFWQRFSIEEKFGSLNRVMKDMEEKADSVLERNSYPEVYAFLLSRFNEPLQNEFIKAAPCRILQCYLEWPWQDMFMAVSRHALPFFKTDDYLSLLVTFGYKLRFEKNIDVYHKLVREFWQELPEDLKTLIRNKRDKFSVFENLLPVFEM